MDVTVLNSVIVVVFWASAINSRIKTYKMIKVNLAAIILFIMMTTGLYGISSSILADAQTVMLSQSSWFHRRAISRLLFYYYLVSSIRQVYYTDPSGAPFCGFSVAHQTFPPLYKFKMSFSYCNIVLSHLNLAAAFQLVGITEYRSR